MNLLCPNCQKMVSVPDEHAGQTMKCPLCSNSFTVPGLPQTPITPPTPPAPEAPDTIATTPDDVYPVRSEPRPPTRGPVPRETVPPAPEPSRREERAERPKVVSEEPQRVCQLALNPHALQWVAPVTMLLVFVLSFFSWVGVYAGGHGIFTQSAWGAAFNGHSEDPALIGATPLKEDKGAPGVNGLMIVYVLLLIPAVALVLAAAVLPALHVHLPPGLHALVPWRWGIATGLILVTLLFLVFQMLIGFSLEYRWQTDVDRLKATMLAADASDQTKHAAEISEAAWAQLAHGTCWLWLAFLLHLTALVGAALTFWLGRREGRPLPRFELHW